LKFVKYYLKYFYLRGKNEQVAVPRYTVDTACSSKPRVEERYMHFSETTRNYEDMLIVYSTIPGYVSYRDEYNGSWFIQILCEVFMNYAHKVHVQELFYMVSIMKPYGNLIISIIPNEFVFIYVATFHTD
jgi:hypothetical protein